MKLFKDAFATVKLQKEEQAIMEEVYVERISSNKEKTLVRIQLLSEHLIQKWQIRKVEAEIARQLFPEGNVEVRIFERFRLSAQYTPENLLDIYWESILEEFREYSPLEHSILMRSSRRFNEAQDEMCLMLENSCIAQRKSADIVRILEKILNERCGFGVHVVTEYQELHNSHIAEEEQRIALEVQAISQNMGGGMPQEKEAPAAQDPANAQEDSKASAGVTKEGGDKVSMSGSGFKRTDRGVDKKLQEKQNRPLKRSDNPDVIFGRDFEEEAIEIENVTGEIGEVVIRGKVLSYEDREIARIEKTLMIFKLTDFTDTISLKLFVKTEQVGEIKGDLQPGKFLKIKGMAAMDNYDHEISITSIAGIKKIPDFTTKRMDHSVRKRVELHCHTKMSDMDGVSEAKDIVKRAYSWGMPAIAITDHGVVQSFPDANHVWDDLWREESKKRKEAGDPDPDRFDFFKVIYGVEAYLVDDLIPVVHNETGQELRDSFVVFDIETTGTSHVNNKIIEIGAVKVVDGKIVDRFSTFVNPQVPIPFLIEQLTSINDSMVIDAPLIEEVLPEFLEFCKGSVMVAHNAEFDMGFIMENCRRQGLPSTYTYIDTLGIARLLLKQAKYTLDAVAKTLKVSLEHHHRAVDDAECTALIFEKLIVMLEEKGILTLKQLEEASTSNPEIIKKMPTYHAIILAKNSVGRTNMYTLISKSHLEYYNRRPRIPKSELLKYREGLILGSACEAGELYRALLDGKDDAEIARLVNFYDYLEIQPDGNNMFMIESERVESIHSVEDIRDVNRRIVSLGEQFHKPVVATCDVHFLDPEDEIYRRIIMAGKGFDDADHQAPLFLRTTEEMLEEFQYLGSEKAEEVVITNTNLIADMIDTMAPVRPDKCPPIIPDSDKTLRRICYNKAHELYGENLPEIVEKRLEKELTSIIGNG
ncbi:MAG: PHP domain-containing protein, partial [Lachnospiraceae bacterium]|nr:PHP domain-containing protein [Lachnospiraceae bacterium]